jgi:hypothetical protein
MGQFVTKVKVKVNKENSLDNNFVFTIVTDGTEADVVKTVNDALRQKVSEGELDLQNLKGVEIKSDDSTGFFGTFVVKNISDFVGSL